MMTPVWVFPAYPLLLVAPFAGNIIKSVSQSPAGVLVNFTAIAFCAITVQGTGFLISFSTYLKSDPGQLRIVFPILTVRCSDLCGILVSPDDTETATGHAEAWCFHLNRTEWIYLCGFSHTGKPIQSYHPVRYPWSRTCSV